MRETSAHMISIEPVVAAVAAQRLCPNGLDGDQFIIAPLKFQFELSPWNCAAGKTAAVSYCTDCASSGYVLVTAPTTGSSPLQNGADIELNGAARRN